MILHFGITIKIGHGLNLARHATLMATVGDRRQHNSTNANTKTNILSMTTGCKEYIGSSQFADPLVGSEGDEIWSVDSQENR